MVEAAHLFGCCLFCLQSLSCSMCWYKKPQISSSLQPGFLFTWRLARQNTGETVNLFMKRTTWANRRGELSAGSDTLQRCMKESFCYPPVWRAFVIAGEVLIQIYCPDMHQTISFKRPSPHIYNCAFMSFVMWPHKMIRISSECAIVDWQLLRA